MSVLKSEWQFTPYLMLCGTIGNMTFKTNSIYKAQNYVGHSLPKFLGVVYRCKESISLKLLELFSWNVGDTLSAS